jgi:DNA replication protein DnaC
MLAKMNEYLDALCMPHAKRTWGSLAESARGESATYEDYLLSVLESECDHRRDRRVAKALRDSRLPLEKNLSAFDLTRLPQKVKQQVKTLLNGDFLSHKENVLVFGNPGSGKTHLLCAIAQELVKQDKRVYFNTCAMLLQELLLAKKELRLPRLMKKFRRYDAVIIDDIGYVQQDKEEMEVLFTLLAQRYEHGSVMITSNLPFSQWEKIFKDPMMTAAAVDRIVHHSVIVELNLESYRVSAAKNRRAKEVAEKA